MNESITIELSDEEQRLIYDALCHHANMMRDLGDVEGYELTETLIERLEE